LQKKYAVLTEIARFQTGGAGFIDIGDTVANWLQRIAAIEGQAVLFIRHTSASLTIQENADPAVCRDLTEFLERTAPEDRAYHHDTEGPDDMPAHIKAMITSTSVTVPVLDGRLLLGTWQGIYLIEHRARKHSREVVMQFMGEVGLPG